MLQGIKYNVEYGVYIIQVSVCTCVSYIFEFYFYSLAHSQSYDRHNTSTVILEFMGKRTVANPNKVHAMYITC